MPDPIGGFAYAWPLLIGLFGGYLLGSIPFGLVLTKMAGLGDIRQVGSGNIGATNVLRTGNKLLAALTLILDGAKGAVAVLLAQMFGPDMASPFYAYFLADWQRAELAAALAVLIFVRHHANIRRLLKGEEPRIGKKKTA